MSGDGGTGLRPDQTQPPRRPLPTPRTLRRQIRLAAADGHPQPPQTPPTPSRHRLTPRAQRRAELPPPRIVQQVGGFNSSQAPARPLRDSLFALRLFPRGTKLLGTEPLKALVIGRSCVAC